MNPDIPRSAYMIYGAITVVLLLLLPVFRGIYHDKGDVVDWMLLGCSLLVWPALLFVMMASFVLGFIRGVLIGLYKVLHSSGYRIRTKIDKSEPQELRKPSNPRLQ